MDMKRNNEIYMVLLRFSWRRGSKDSRGQGFKCLFSKDFISAFNILSISAIFVFAVPNSPFSIKSKSPANNICVSFFEHFFSFHLNPWTLEPLDPSVVFKAFHSNSRPRPINLTILSINYHHYEA